MNLQEIPVTLKMSFFCEMHQICEIFYKTKTSVTSFTKLHQQALHTFYYNNKLPYDNINEFFLSYRNFSFFKNIYFHKKKNSEKYYYLTYCFYQFIQTNAS